ncbi:MAG: TetR/AcrR family transcriptional regulator, partial [Archangium sp.]
MAERKRSEAGPTRRRRSPEQAKQEILDAAERLIAASGPDGVGLQQVAREAGVSHALVTHYFGTYDGLVREALVRRMGAAREEVLALLASPDWEPGRTPVLDVLFELLKDPALVRLMAWAALSGRGEVFDLMGSAGGLRQVVDGMMELRQQSGAKQPPAELRREVEFLVLLAFSACFGFG